MRPFTTLSGVAAPIPIANIDTDQLAPARFLKCVSKKGLGRGLFHALRFDGDDVPRPDFILNRAPWDSAEILITLDNFGCGSSREHAPWALDDFGIRAIIAPSFADIFRINCLQNGLLPITLSRTDCLALMEQVAQPALSLVTVDLSQQTVRAGQICMRFVIDPHDKARLLEGRDQIDDTLGFLPQLEASEARLAPPPLAGNTWS